MAVSATHPAPLPDELLALDFDEPLEPARRRRWALAVGGVVLLALLLRLWGIKTGLPYAYNIDEYYNYVPHSIALFGHGWNPQYFNNPPGFTYLLYLFYGVWFGGRVALQHTMATNPTEVWVLARVTAAILGAVAVWLLYLCGARLIDRRTGLLAAGLMAVAFLPVFYAHQALNDVPTLAPLTLSLWGTAGALRMGRRRDYAIAGVGLGLACATKYTAGIVVVPLLVATAVQYLAPGGQRSAIEGLAIGAAAAAAAFIIANPYSVGSFSQFWNGVSHQQSVTDETGKLGLTHGSGISYYLWTLTWGIGWVPTLAALGGAIALWWDERRLTVLLTPAAIAFLIFMGTQGRYFGRWLMPILPILCLLGAYFVLQAAEWAAWRRPELRPTLIAVAVVALCAQGLVHSVHAGLINSRSDTRNETRAWLVANVPQCTKIVVEPVVPNSWFEDIGSASGCPNGYRWTKFPALRTHVDPTSGQLAVDAGSQVTLENYERTLRPDLIDLYVNNGYCWVVSGETQAGRATAEPQLVPQAIAYYRALRNRGQLVYEASPYGSGKKAVPFNFDWTFDYYSLSYSHPGPLMSVYHLTGGLCGK
jgi:4-amino-4-deoxy-L-arabinose transferase-like glycosyltransferase